jgi:hypothetical protein
VSCLEGIFQLRVAFSRHRDADRRLNLVLIGSALPIFGRVSLYAIRTCIQNSHLFSRKLWRWRYSSRSDGLALEPRKAAPRLSERDPRAAAIVLVQPLH